MKVKVRKRPNSTTPIRGAIAPAGDTTLRCNHSTSHLKWYVGAPQGIEIAPASDFGWFRGSNPSPASIFSKIWAFWHFECMHQSSLCTYNFLNSQRLAVILAENLPLAEKTWSIWKLFRITSFTLTKNIREHRKRIDCTTAIRGAIALADDITLRM